MSIAGLIRPPHFVGLFSHETGTLSNGRSGHALLFGEGPQNPSFTVELDQAVAAHSFLEIEIPAQCFDTVPALTQTYPPPFQARYFHHPHGQNRWAVAFAKRL